MHISSLTLVNYRNFSSARLNFEAGINTIIGENGSGKSNVFRALRLLLDANLLASAYRIRSNDFHRGLGDWRGHWIIISVEFSQISADESVQALFVHGTGNIEASPIDRSTYSLIYRPTKDIRTRLASLVEGDRTTLDEIRNTITSDDYEILFTGRSAARFDDPETYNSIVGDFNAVKFSDDLESEAIGVRLPKQLSVAKEISFTYIQALRDVIEEFRHNRTNPLKTLLQHKSGEINKLNFAVVTDQARELNRKIEQLPDVADVRQDIQQTVMDTVGAAYSPSSLSIKSDLPDEADRLFQSLKLYLGEHGEEYEGEIHELSLGGANLIYLTLKLLEFRYQRPATRLRTFY
ncbi:AAA family ATPase [Mycobacterium senriense]|uniref:Endonuclease GajA/Old nuclease/RecF-like AAA domain-containing protein n=1 Tax=Mycobacterium senriense TaxID=2775496 RepID=A0ABN6ICW8_9MYCO|nr:AAA family ATPase [Mycobacterium senriense]BCZ20763.1 hypothetical protein MTY59_06180 [Mycobacterium senriense]